ncbi:DUF3667 domain-containing protein [Cognatiluteimonas profundi]|uniref:DUF3667 domain-containing protein n=1 Tax=Cognatiluteimonas profundi TaxID=2594501 RepID=UPI00131B7466|nr:DUF3667 domain-containing protein [Lysobacter profundi]
MTDPSATPAMPGPLDAQARPAACQNCGAPLLGPHCYQCGQPVSGLVRHFSSIIGDALDTILNIDARVFRTLWPLLARPGYLTCEYFAGRRVRYVSPVRLFVFLSILTFFVARLTINIPGDAVHFDSNDAIGRATTVAQVERLRDTAIASVARGRQDAKQRVPGLDARLAVAQTAIRAKADRRIAELTGAAARGEPPPESKPEIMFDGKPWDPKTHPLALQWLPDFGNDWLNRQVARAESNIARMQRDPSLFKDAALSAIPSTLFVLLPVFALMLEILYVFKRRLYMEHLIVALHSHAFLCLSLLLVFLAMALRQWLAPASGALHSLLGLVEGVLFAWMPLYLLLMQKRVYGQGWPMTLTKYAVLGLSYTILLSLGAAFTIIASLVSA